MWPLYIIFGTCLLAFVLFDYVKNRNYYEKASHIAGPTPYPIIGNLATFLNKNLTTEMFFSKFLNVCDSYPSPNRLWIGNQLWIQIYNPDQLKAIFQSPKTLEKGNYYKYGYPWLGHGLVVAPLNVWKVHRKLIQPTFHAKVLETFFEIFTRHSVILVEETMNKYQENEFDVLECLSACTLSIICETAMGVSVSWTKERQVGFAKAAHRAMNIIVTRLFKVWLKPDFIFKHSQASKDFQECVEYMHNITDEVIQIKKKDFENDKRKKEVNGLQRKVFLDLLMELKETKLTEKEIRDEVNTMIVAGSDTIANALSFCTLMLASYPEIQDKVYQELYEIYGDDNIEHNPLKHDDLPKMVYLERVIKESLRLFPALPIILRKATGDIEIGEYTFPKDAILFLVLNKVHRDETIWPNPLKFDPDRFLPEEVAKRHPFAYLPFAAGPRNCIGLRYAMMSMKVFLATVIRKCVIKKDKIVPVKDVKVNLDILLKPVEPIMLRFEKRITNL